MGGSRDAPRVRAVLLAGHSNAGKSPLGRLIEARGTEDGPRRMHLDFGELLRRTVAGTFDPSLDAAELAFLSSAMDGRLLDDGHFSIARKVVERFLHEREFDRPRDLLVLNGMPRYAGQARDVAVMGIDVRLVVHLRCDAQTARARKLLAEAGEGHEDRGGRGDEAPEAFRRKIESHERETVPMLGFYRRRGIAVVEIDVTEKTTPREMYAACARHLRDILA